ncbi:spermatogenesis-associated protein 31E1-like [Lepus europaeus]|uniref:spermatogenesis-associated protein 31E1-like n=1 Tax=Lepus europaeus TaxID=9983 RepID=UPI002B49E6AD|nr:spermatogenesis-associated protein 31E1-like [Lepus europaeus]
MIESHLLPLSPSCASCVVDVILPVLCGVGLFLLILPWLQSKPAPPPPRTKGVVRKPVPPVSHSHLGKLSDKGSCLQLPCDDPPDKESKPVPSPAQWPCGECEDAAAATLSLSASLDPPTEAPLPLACTPSPGPITSRVSLGSESSAPCSPEPLLPLEHLSLQAPGLTAPSPGPPDLLACPHHPPDLSLALPHCSSKILPLGSTPQSPSPPNCWLTSANAGISGLGHPSCPVSALSWWKVAARAWCLSTSPHCRSQEEGLSRHPPEASFCKDLTHRQPKAGGPRLINPNVQKLLEILVSKRADVNVWQGEAEREGSDHLLDSLGLRFRSSGEQPEIVILPPFWGTRERAEQLPGPPQLPYPKGQEDHFEQKWSQLFWGLPVLHSESLVATVSVSGPPVELSSILFNGLNNSFPLQIQAKTPPQLFPSQLVLHRMIPPPSVTPNLPWSQPPSLAQIQPQPLSSSSLQIPSSYSCDQICEPSFPTRREVQFVIPTAIQHLEHHLLKKQRQSRRALPQLVKKSHEIFSQCMPNSWASQDHRPGLDLLEDFISPELRQQLEQHLQTRFTQHLYRLPHRIQLSLGPMQSWDTFPGTSQAKDELGSSWPSVFALESNQSTQTMESRSPARFQLGEDSSKDVGRCLGRVPRDPPRGSRSSLAKIQGVSYDVQSGRDSVDSSRSDSESDSLRSLHEHLDNVLRVHLGRKLEGIKASRDRGGAVPNYRLGSYHTSAPPEASDAYAETGNPASSKHWESCEITSQMFLNPGTQGVLEAHVKRLQVRHRWALPLKVLKPINHFKLKKAQAPPLPWPTVPSSATCGSEANFLEGPHRKGSEETVMTREPVLTLKRALPIPWPAYKRAQGALGVTPSWNICALAKVPGAGEAARLHSQPLTSSSTGRTWHGEAALEAGQGSPEQRPSSAAARNEAPGESGVLASPGPCSSPWMLEFNGAAQCPWAGEVSEAVKLGELKSSTWEAGVAADPQTLCGSLSVDSLGTSRSPSASSISMGHREGAPDLKAQAVDEKALQAEAESESESLAAAGLLLQDLAPEMILTADILAFQASRARSGSVCSSSTSASRGLSDLLWRAERSWEQQGPRIPKARFPWERERKVFSPTDKPDVCRRLRHREQEERLAGQRAPQAPGTCHPTQGTESVESLRIKTLLPLPNQTPLPPASRLGDRVRNLLRRLFPNRGKRQEDVWQSGSAISRMSMSVKEPAGTATQTPEEKLGFHHELSAAQEKSYKEESQGPVEKTCLACYVLMTPSSRGTCCFLIHIVFSSQVVAPVCAVQAYREGVGVSSS